MSSTSSHRELHHRSGDGTDVWLMWDPSTDSVSVRVSDSKAGAAFEIPVKARHRAMDVFHHPFAYAA
jgi:YD repeat-containing protein